VSESLSKERALLIGISAVAFGVGTLLRKISVETLHPFQFQIVAGSLYGLLVIPWYFVAKETGHAEVWNIPGIIWCLICTMLGMLGAVILMYALRTGHDTGLVAALGSVSPIVTVMLAALFLGEQPSLKQAIGIFLVLVGVVIASSR
jgi:transporter family protein